MGHIFDVHSARLYESWCRSPQGKMMEKLAGQFMMLQLEPQTGEKVLDIGCGSGNQLLFYSRLGLDITGLDASPCMIDKARKRLGERCVFKKGQAEDLPFEDNEFDLATLNNTLEFIDNPVKALQEAGRVARRGIFVGVMNSLSWYSFQGKVQGLFRDSVFKHARPLNLWEIKSYFLAALGPVPLKWRSSSFCPWLLDNFGGFFTKAIDSNHWPFGTILGVSAKVLYSVKTNNIPLKIDMKKAGQTIPSGATMGHLRHQRGVHFD
jgi:SAM-dependent methyltransferase